MTVRWYVSAVVTVSLLMLLLGCGGGGSSGGGEGTITTPPVTPPTFTITTSSLPTAVQGLSYTAVLSVQNGTSPFSWSIDPGTSSQLPNGLSLDPATGTISGTPSSTGYLVVAFKVVDSSSPARTATQNVPFLVNPALGLQVFSTSVNEYQSLFGSLATPSGGVLPYRYSVAQGSLPPGMRLDPSSGSATGAAIAVGSFTFTLAVQDSYLNPEVVSQPMTIQVNTPPLQFGYSMNGLRLILNKPFTGHLIAAGGTPPYTFQISGSLPPGLALVDPSTGLISGTPTTVGGYGFTPVVTDSASPHSTQYGGAYVTVGPALGRNDSPSTATPISNGSYSGSISPALDSTGSLAPDTDYYKVIGAGGSIMHFATTAKQINPNNPLDTVIELTDANGGRLATGCNQPGGSTDFTSVCLNDDISASPHIQDSMLDYKVPGTSGTQTVLVHVFDWSGNARPDMTYSLQVNGAVDPLATPSISLASGIVGKAYSQTLSHTGGAGTVSFSVTSGSLPPGLTVSGSTVSGTPTSTGNYSFTMQATDQSTPPQQATASLSLAVANALSITTTQVPDGTVGTPYSFKFTSTGGLPPIYWTCYLLPPGLVMNVDGTVSGNPTQSGTFSFPVTVNDSSTYPNQYVSQTFSMTIH